MKSCLNIKNFTRSNVIRRYKHVLLKIEIAISEFHSAIEQTFDMLPDVQKF